LARSSSKLTMCHDVDIVPGHMCQHCQIIDEFEIEQ